MEDTIDICSGCGKMPRAIDNMKGYFLCSRCGCRATVTVGSDEYEKIASELDAKFHEMMMRKKVEAVSKEPIMPKSSKKSKRKAAAKKETTKAASKKPKAKKKTVKVTKKKAKKVLKKKGRKK